MTEPTSFNAPKKLIQRVNRKLGYGDSRSEYIREAIELRLELEEVTGKDMSNEETRQSILNLVEAEFQGD